jgi:uncharacterized protein YndB with AHSA1/START domain
MSSKKLEKFIQAPPAEVFVYFTNSTALKDWLCDLATVDPRPGGRLYMWWNGDYYTSGEYLVIEKDKSVSFSWFGREEPHATRVDVTLKNQKGGTLVRLIHRKIGKNQKWNEIGAEYEKQWAKGLENLASVLENGPDLRITNRPMLGIYTDIFNAGVAEKLSIPIKEGLRLGGVVEGLGAQKAGLQADDVIFEMNGLNITGAATFASFIGNKLAGEIIEVTFYRCAEKITVKMTLSGRPIPPIPASGIELSKQIEPTYIRFENEIETLLNDTSDLESTKKPAPSEWSVNEVLAHLIHSELGWQNLVTEIMGGHESFSDDWGGNIQAYIDAIVSVFPTKTELFKQLKIHDAVTLKLLANIPQEFLTHKGRFWKLAFQANQNPYHLQTHLEQMKAAIHASRK